VDYLKDDQYYIDLYDLHTIEECLDYYWSIKNGFIKSRKKEFPKYTDEKFNQEINKCLNMMLFGIKGERYRHKVERIKEWTEKDKLVQEKYDKAIPPLGVLCRKCHSSTKVTSKDLLGSFEPDSKVLFMFECLKCKKRQALYEDGSEWEYEKPRCPKCKSPLKNTVKKPNKDLLIFIDSCTKCSYSKKYITDFEKSRKEQEEKEAKHKKLLETYRKDFVLDDKSGQEYIEQMEAMEVASIIREEERQKYESPVYQRSLQLKKTTIIELEKLLIQSLEKAKYIKLSFDKPEIGQYVIVPFTIQDSDSSRKDRISSFELEKVIKDTLEDTNWRLLSNSIMYRLGFLEGKLKGYEQEEDMLKLAGKKEETKPKPKIDEAKRQKYVHTNVVQMARLLGEFDGIENTRKRRLEKEPDGFFLNDGKEGYTCGVCHESISGNNTWWDLKGIRCGDCQRNLKAGTVPLAILEDDYGYDVVIRDWEFKDDYGVHPSTVRKLKREGLLIGHDLKREDGSVYYTIYLTSDNKEFLKKYPKKKSDIKITISDKDGKSIEL